jgi:hypothetical protein
MSLSQHYQSPQDFENFAFVPLTSNARLRQMSLSLHNNAPRVWFVFGNLVFENREEGILLTPLATGLC